MRKDLLMDSGWKFRFCEKDLPMQMSPVARVNRTDDDNAWETVNLPHDYQRDAAYDSSFPSVGGFRETRNALYRKTFLLPEAYRNRHLTLCFEGIARSATVFLNGSLVGRSFSPYLPVYVDLCDHASFGNRANTLTVFVDGISSQGWWYEGEGIYRHVRLLVREKVHLKEDTVFCKPLLRPGTENEWTLTCSAEVRNTLAEDCSLTLRFTLLDGELPLGITETEVFTAAAEEETSASACLTVLDPGRWSPDTPRLYRIRTELLRENAVLDEETTEIGFRTFEGDSEGFLLNGKRIRLYGTCNHQDHAGIGAAVPDSLWEYRIRRLKEMGCNAFRCAHNPPARELLEACDRLGMLVMDENRLFSTDPDSLSHLDSMVRRDRNHPSVVFYSMANEELKLSEPEGGRMFRRMKSHVRKLDDTRMVTAALKGGYEGAEGSVPDMDAVGVNYDVSIGLPFFRKNHADRCIFGSETNSALSTRGCLVTDPEKCEIACYEGQIMDPDAQRVKDIFAFMRKNPWYGGFFVWTGFDYRGEPTPYGWPQNTSQFGIMDVCGFPKDSYWQFRACTLQTPVLHLVPHWNHTPGETVRVLAMSNCEEVELFLNGRSLGRKPSDPCECAEWQVPFERGKLSAIGYRENLPAAEDCAVTSGTPVRICISPDREEIRNDGMDAVPLNLSVVDGEGNVCETASDLLRFEVIGDGVFLGAGNGNPTSREPEGAPEHRLYAGHAQMIVRSEVGARNLTVRVTGDGLLPAEFSFRILSVPAPESISSVPCTEQYCSAFELLEEVFDRLPDAEALNSGFPGKNWTPLALIPWYVEPRISHGFFVLRTKITAHPAGSDRTELYFYRACLKSVRFYLDGKPVPVLSGADGDGTVSAGDAPLRIAFPLKAGETAELVLVCEANEGVPSGFQQPPISYSVPDAGMR